jgi:hypothetical protein
VISYERKNLLKKVAGAVAIVLVAVVLPILSALSDDTFTASNGLTLTDDQVDRLNAEWDTYPAEVKDSMCSSTLDEVLAVIQGMAEDGYVEQLSPSNDRIIEAGAEYMFKELCPE